jgi:hypothetical protein
MSTPSPHAAPDSLAAAFARAMAAKDHDMLRELIHPEVDFRAMTPRKTWDAAGPEDILSTVGIWFSDEDEIIAVEAVEIDGFADVERVGYRLRVRTEGVLYLVEQQAYLSEVDGRIGWLRIMCSGYRPIEV